MCVCIYGILYTLTPAGKLAAGLAARTGGAGVPPLASPRLPLPGRARARALLPPTLPSVRPSLSSRPPAAAAAARAASARPRCEEAAAAAPADWLRAP